MTIRQLLLSGLLALGLTATAAPVAAQSGPFSPAVYVNDRVVTRFEVEQNLRFMQVLRQPGDLEKLAVERLIEDALRRDAAKAAGVSVTPEEVAAGMTEFAGRASLTTEQFLNEIGKEGVAPETFRAFVEAGLLWRKVVGTKFGPRVQITDAEIDRAIAAASRQTSVQVLISELILRADSPEAQAASMAIAERLAGQTMSEGAFAEEARTNSVSGSRDAGGRLDWLPLGNLPPLVASQVLGLAPGQVSQPFPVPNAIILFYLRDLRETGTPEQTVVALDWAEYDVTSAAEAARIAGEVDTCDDLYGIARGQPETRLRRETRSPADVPGDIAMALARLDDNEFTASFSRAGRPVFLMLCARSHATPGLSPEAPATAEAPATPDAPSPEAGPNREQVRSRLVNQRLGAIADGYLAELKADATIRFP